MKEVMLAILLLFLSSCASVQVIDSNESLPVFVTAKCGPFKGAEFGEYVNVTLPKGADRAQMSEEIYKQVHDLSPNYFKYEFCDERCEQSFEDTTIASLRVFECHAKSWKIRCGYDLDSWVCVNATN